MGGDPQDVINEQIPDDYDLFVGIMWYRYGTPTGRSGSGTREEFERAKTRYDADPSNVKLMLYFKDEPVKPSGLDPYQLSKVHEFRDSLGDEGALYWKFTDVENFEKLIRVHLTRQVQAWKAQLQVSGGSAVRNEPVGELTPESEAESVDDFGILDLIEIFKDRFEDLVEISNRIGTATEDLTETIIKRTTELNVLHHDSTGIVRPKETKRIISRVSSGMDNYTARIEAELPLFRDAFDTGMNAIISSLSMTTILNYDETVHDQSIETMESLSVLQTSLDDTETAMNAFRREIFDLPPVTSELNRAKRKVVSVVDRLISEINNGQTLLSEAKTIVRNFLNDDNT